MKTTKTKQIAIIGSGFGGLSAAITLAKQGYRVTIFEKNSYVGGKAGELLLKGFRFDMGPSLLTMPQVFDDLLADTTSTLEYKPLPRLCKYFYPDGTTLSTSQNKKELYKELTTKTSVTEKQLDNYFSYCKQIYNFAKDPFIYNPFIAKDVFSRKNKQLLTNVLSLDPFKTMNRGITKYISDPKIIQLFERYATYVGSNPYVAPATLNVIPHVEYELGGYYPTKGIRSIVDALEQAALSLGVIIKTNIIVDKILIEQKKVVGVQINNEKHNFDAVISNSDAVHTHKVLLAKPKHFQVKREPSSSALVFYWGVTRTHKELDTHNILFTDDYAAEFDHIFNKKEIYNDPTIYINISSKYRRADAPKNCENWFVMINTPYNIGQDWDAIVKHVRPVLISTIQKRTGIDIANNIITEAVLTPKHIQEQTYSNKGAIYGTSSNSKLAAFLRLQNKSFKYKHLYFCGGSAHPGGGMSMSALSGTFAADLCMEDMEKLQ